MTTDSRMVDVHIVNVEKCDSAIKGRAYQPRCTVCRFKGTHYEREARAQQAAREHELREQGLDVAAR